MTKNTSPTKSCSPDRRTFTKEHFFSQSTRVAALMLVAHTINPIHHFAHGVSRGLRNFKGIIGRTDNSLIGSMKLAQRCFRAQTKEEKSLT